MNDEIEHPCVRRKASPGLGKRGPWCGCCGHGGYMEYRYWLRSPDINRRQKSLKKRMGGKSNVRRVAA